MKCRYWKHCTLYRYVNNSCNKSSGDAYGIGRKGGCYRDLEENGKDSKFYKK